MSKKAEKEKRTYIGGQAVMEGIMMRGRCAMATAVRDPEGEIQIESERLTPPEKRSKFSRLPFVRGVFSFVSSLVDGNRILMRSADIAIEETENPTKAEKWLEEKHHVDLSGFFNSIAVFIGVIIALGIFIALPQWLTSFLPTTHFDAQSAGLPGLWFNLAEGGIRLIIFVLYIVLISLIPSLRRVFMCHGAEHKTITCYEKDKPLTVENVRGCSRVHDRCGTTFLFLVMIVSILVFSLVNVLLVKMNVYNGQNEFLSRLIRIGFKILTLPVIAGVSYEILRLLSKTKSKFFLIFKAPGLLLQKLTTREPEDGMIECAIAAFNTVLAMDADPTIPEKVFAVQGKMSALLKNTKKRFADNGIDEEEAEWIFALSLDIPKSAINDTERILRVSQAKEIIRIADERLTGRPLWYIIGDADFCGYKIKVDERVLIPRPETEEMAMMVVGIAEEGQSILDMCTGSGAIAIAVQKELQKRGVKVKMTATDISEDALALAQENAEEHRAKVEFIRSDLFEKVRGKFDIIVTNPPYIPTATIETLQREVKDFEPRLALDGGEDGLDIYRKIAASAGRHIVRGGTLIMEVGEGEAKAVAKLFKGDHYTIIGKDFNGVERYVKIIY